MKHEARFRASHIDILTLTDAKFKRKLETKLFRKLWNVPECGFTLYW